MSVSTEVQRTLVKSPPELWSELSNPDALGRHLGQLGEIRIVRAEPETKVEWEADGATGVVELKQSGWGTKVTLSVTREPPAAAQPVVEAEAEGEREAVCAVVPEPEAEVEPPAEPDVEPEPPAEAEVEPEAESVTTAQPESAAEKPGPIPQEPGPQLGFFARLFRRRKARPVEIAEPAPEPIYPERATEPEVVEPASDLGAELTAVEEQMTEQTVELLTSVLDRLGAAHHRPFSRG